MFKVSIDLSTDIQDLRVPDGLGGTFTVNLSKGLNEVPLAVAEHWYVRKFIVQGPETPRVFVPVVARPVTAPVQLTGEAADAAPAVAAEAAEPKPLARKSADKDTAKA
jgi:hypothetical protein